jgi:hypothetical protein
MRDGRLRGLEHARLDRAAFLIVMVELGRDRRRLQRVVGRQQPHAEIGRAHPSGGIDARTQGKAEVGRRRRLRQPRRIEQSRQADIAPRRQHLQALRHERPVETPQLRHVRHGPERYQVEQVDQPRLGPPCEEAAGAQTRINAAPSRKATPTAARCPCSAASSASSSRLGFTSASAVGSRLAHW